MVKKAMTAMGTDSTLDGIPDKLLFQAVQRIFKAKHPDPTRSSPIIYSSEEAKAKNATNAAKAAKAAATTAAEHAAHAAPADRTAAAAAAAATAATAPAAPAAPVPAAANAGCVLQCARVARGGA